MLLRHGLRVMVVSGVLLGCGSEVVGTGGDGGAGPLADAGQAGEGLPCEVATLLQRACVSCHGNPLGQRVPAPLMNRAHLLAASVTHPATTMGAESVLRMRSTAAPMPPGTERVREAELVAFEAWVNRGMPEGRCAVDAGAPDPLNAAPRCTSDTTWTRGNAESPFMNPGQACITCHRSMRGPSYAFAGTVFASGHEPDNCNGAASTGADPVAVRITDANGRVFTLTPNAAGNFYTRTSFTPPYRAEVTWQGRTRVMQGPQTNGDCNSCHTQTGAQDAPGRITLP